MIDREYRSEIKIIDFTFENNSCQAVSMGIEEFADLKKNHFPIILAALEYKAWLLHR